MSDFVVGVVKDTNGKRAFVRDRRFPNIKQVNGESLIGKKFDLFWIGTEELAVKQKDENGKKIKDEYGYFVTQDEYEVFDEFTERRPRKLTSKKYLVPGFIENPNGNFEFNPNNGFRETSEIKEEKLQKKLNSNSYKIRNSKSVKKTSDFFGDVWYLIKVIIFIFLFFQLIGMSTWPN